MLMCPKFAMWFNCLTKTMCTKHCKSNSFVIPVYIKSLNNINVHQICVCTHSTYTFGQCANVQCRCILHFRSIYIMYLYLNNSYICICTNYVYTHLNRVWTQRKWITNTVQHGSRDTIIIRIMHGFPYCSGSNGFGDIVANGLFT